jgi:isopenicillin-N epimerase
MSQKRKSQVDDRPATTGRSEGVKTPKGMRQRGNVERGATLATIASDESYWAWVQQAFNVDRTIINLNNARISPAAQPVCLLQQGHAGFANLAPPYNLRQILQPQVEGVRAKLASSFGCDPEEIAITRNASESLENCIYGLPLKTGDEVLTTDQDHPGMIVAWQQRVRRDGIRLNVIPIEVPPPSMEYLARSIAESITPSTRVIMVCHITPTTGQVFPIRRICQMGREGGIEVIVDGAQAFAQIDFRQEELDCDYYGVSLHKWLCAAEGTGFLYVRKEKIRALWPLMGADESLNDNIRKFEGIGTYPVANYTSIAAALTLHETIGGQTKASRLRYLKERWVQRLRVHKNVRMLTPDDPLQSCGIATFTTVGINVEEVASRLWNEHHILVGPFQFDKLSGIRVSPQIYNTVAEIDSFCEAMESILDKPSRQF